MSTYLKIVKSLQR